MKIAEQMSKHIAALSAPHMEATHNAITATYPNSNPDVMHAVVLEHQLDILLHRLAGGDQNSVVVFINGRFGGDCDECGPIATDYKPFVDLFSDIPGFVP
jgi:hypothetical protein